jgi:hypothetical protein
LILTQTAIGGSGGQRDSRGGEGGSASSILVTANPSGSSNLNVTAVATGGAGGTGTVEQFLNCKKIEY